MKLGFIGAGKVGTSMGIYLNNYPDISVTGYYSLNPLSAVKAASYTESTAYDNLPEIVQEAELIGITTPDDIIIKIVNQLIGLKSNLTDKIIFHTSGVHSSEILKPLQAKGATILSIHPMLSFGEIIKTEEDLNTTFFTIEGQGKRMDQIYNLLNGLNNPWLKISLNDKTAYHLAASIVSNYLVTLLDIGIKIFVDIGFTEKKAKELIQPLLRKTLDNVIETGTENALTGPIARGDIGTIEKHMDKISQSYHDILDIYQQLGYKTTDLAKSAGKIDLKTATKIKEVLKKYE